MKKRIIAFICVFMMFTQQVNASVLGIDILGWSLDIASGTKIFKNTFMSDKDGIGQQAEYYAEYVPNEDVVPIIVSGEEMWGVDKIHEAEEYLKENDIVPMLGINASYFSLKTGIPMGHVISEGKIISKDTETYQSIGFYPDGNAFIAPLSIKTTLYSDEIEVDIAHINKYNQKVIDIVNLYTPEFAEHTHNDCLSLNIILGEIEGELGIDEELTAVVEEKFNYHGSIKIPEDKLVITINEISRPELYEALMSLEIGDEISISSTATGNDDWGKVDSALGSVGETLIVDGEVQTGFSSEKAPRTAVGITEDGNVIFYVIDGRQKPYSVGVDVDTLAKRMEELGCVDAINLDGGGSTIISGVYPGSDASTIFNSPSDGRPRGVSNYIFLKNTKSPTNEADKLFLYPFEEHYLSGYTDILTPKAVDSEYYPTKLPKKIEYSVDGTESVIDNNGVLIAIGEGKFTVNANGDNAVGEATYNVYETPTNIDVFNAENRKEITELTVMKDDRIKLDIKAQYEYIDLKSTIDCYRITVPKEIGYMEDDELVITAEIGESMIFVSAGEYTTEIPITVKRENPFFDTDEHWAKKMIKGVYEKGIVNGVILDGKPMFLPDNNITREEFAVIVCNFLDIDTSKYEEFDLSVFSDSELISEWAKPYVSAVYDIGAINGKTDGDNVNFAPKDTLTRAETMTILGRIISDEDEYLIEDKELTEEIDEVIADSESEISVEPVQKETKLPFTDYNEIPEWAMKYVVIMVEKGYVSGYDDNTIKPYGNVLRAEAATIIYNML